MEEGFPMQCTFNVCGDTGLLPNPGALGEFFHTQYVPACAGLLEPATMLCPECPVSCDGTRLLRLQLDHSV